MQNLNQNLHNVVEKIEKARLRVDAKHIVKIVAVSKYSDSDAIKELYNLGQRAFGENKVQDLKTKSEKLNNLPLEWHFIGRLQTNKINQLIKLEPFLIQSIDSFELAYELDKRLNNQKLDCLLQINSAYEVLKAGVMPEVAEEEFYKIKQSCKNLNLIGVMSIGAHIEDKVIIQKSFEKTREIFEKLNTKYCSMGMSGDYELAIECGSNLVRIGGALFK